ncbi:aspartate aminotransferase family protein [Actomonas aquatica]|uniref:Acetylornithine aminotransferase n=1 Tax=Actomonas aquatica TaxID=2866162 RepID=A0ABZ1CDN0_9BACT|nr:aspartate aminotransferase family protein [Opitutus sp. WL0086]WRQ89770.1 aspartate aminotransferase family protein [Opitutus sp. WL0086]
MSAEITRTSTAEHYDSYVVQNYGRAPLTLVRGAGSKVWDDAGREYLDFTSGIAVSALGHCHPHWVSTVQRQAGELIHTSNLFRNPNQGELARRLVQRAGPGRVFFCNSGAEANEGLLKLARLHGMRKAGGVEGKCYKVICAEKAFHGRTFGGMSATPQEKIQGGFRPLVPGFAFGKLNDLQSFADLIDEDTAAIFIETIQGEGGVNPATPEFLRGLRKLCSEHNLLLLLDEVQCGIGRTGKFYAFEHADVRPDAIGMAKGLGGGFPIGAIWIGEGSADLFKPGSHGTTFGGTPLACAAALAVLDIIEREKLLEHVEAVSAAWHQRLLGLVGKYPQHLSGVRGLGFMVGLQMVDDAAGWVGKLRDAGLLVPMAGGNVVRLLPPLNATTAELEKAVMILDQVLGAST